jgi:hypothetical protein
MTNEVSPLIGANDQRARNSKQAAGQVRSGDYTTGDQDDTSDQPLNWNGSWKQIPLYPPSGVKSRQPTIRRPENLVDPTPEKYALSNQYWNEVTTSTWAQLKAAVAKGFHIGLVPARSGMVVLDCDVKRYSGDYVYNGDGSVGLPEVTVKRGIDDLQREVEKLGHSLGEIKTYCVQTKSGGYHLYFKQNPRYPITRTLHHRNEWRVDVIATENNWVAAPPTPNYHVVTDVEVIEMPEWLALFLLNLENETLPLGGKRRVAVNAAVRSYQNKVNASLLPGAEPGDTSDLWSLYIESLIYQIKLANQYGGWNNTIYSVTLELLRLGYDVDSVREAVVAAAEPVSELEKRKAEDTIASAHRGYRRTGGSVV